MAELEIEIDGEKLYQAVQDAEGLRSLLQRETSRITANANANGSGFATGYYYRDHKAPAVGGTHPVYEGDVQRRKRTLVGIIHPANYAAMKDNHKNNTLLKSI